MDETIKCGALGVEVPAYRQEQLMPALIVLLKTHLFSLIQKLEGSTLSECPSNPQNFKGQADLRLSFGSFNKKICQWSDLGLPSGLR